MEQESKLSPALLEALWACAASTDYAADKAAMVNDAPQNIRILRDCAALCVVGAQMHMRGSIFTPTILEQCLTACNMCDTSAEYIWMVEATERCSTCILECEKFLNLPSG